MLALETLKPFVFKRRCFSESRNQTEYPKMSLKKGEEKALKKHLLYMTATVIIIIAYSVIDEFHFQL